MAKEVLSDIRRIETECRIREQQSIVDALEPGTPRHEMATRILLLMQDGLHLLMEMERLRLEDERAGRKAAE